MAERRMFSKSIVESDSFMDMPCSAQSLYLHLGMAADDWGFINNPRAVRRMCGASEDDLRLLASKKFILEFPSGAAVIKAWWINNYVPADRRHATRYQEELAMCYIDENKSYTLRDTGVRPADMFTSPKPVYKLYTEDRLGKDRLGEGSNSSKVDTQPDPERILVSAGPGGDAATASAKRKPKPQKHKYGEDGNVLLTDDELAKLKERFPDWSERIDNLSLYLSSTGKSYKSHYSTILNWARRDANKARPARMDSAVLSALDSVM